MDPADPDAEHGQAPSAAYSDSPIADDGLAFGETGLGAAAGEAAPRIGLIELAVDIVIRPARAMRALARDPGRRWLLPVAVLAGVSTAAALAAIPASRELQRQMLFARFEETSSVLPEGQTAEDLVEMTTSGPFAAVTGAMAVVGAVVGSIGAALVVAAILHLMGTLIGGQQTYSEMLTVTAWARVPLILGGLLWLAYLLTGHFDPHPAGLSGLVAPSPLDADAEQSFLQPVLAQIELWNLWYLGLLVLAVGAASRVSRTKAAAAVAVIVALNVSLGVIGVGLARTFSGMLGG